MSEMKIVRERQVIQNVLETYRDFPVLWKQSHELYGNKAARKECYERLLEIYKIYDPEMKLYELKRKLENMRTAYRRERGKVLRSQMNGKEEHVPILWYYNFFTFLDDNLDTSASKKTSHKKEKEEGEEEEDEEEEEATSDRDHLMTESRSNSPPPKKKRRSNLIFLSDRDHDQADTYTIEENRQSKFINEETSSTESFGKTIGLQLNDLNMLQRFIAEKLISDVIFYGRLNKLQPSTALNINNNEY